MSLLRGLSLAKVILTFSLFYVKEIQGTKSYFRVIKNFNTTIAVKYSELVIKITNIVRLMLLNSNMLLLQLCKL